MSFDEGRIEPLPVKRIEGVRDGSVIVNE